MEASKISLLAMLGLLGLAAVALAATPDYQMMGTNSAGCEIAVCRTRGKCNFVRVICPTSCKSRDGRGPGKRACFIDCAYTCKAICKHRKPNCVGYGAVCYDPRFIGGDGVMFYFHGQKDQDFCIVSDSKIHINAHFIGKRPEGRSRDYTWVQGLGMLFDSHKVSVAAKKVATWVDDIDQLALSFDGEDITLPEHEGAVWTSTSGKVVVERTAAVNNLHIFIDQLVEASVTVVPITEKESKVHNYQITKDDCFAHLQMQFHFFNLSASVNGVLGQTYQPEYKTPVKVGAAMPIMGGNDKFFSSSLLSADCKANQFAAADAESSVKSPLESFTVQCSNNGGSFTCRR